jgi:hypothetical protein
LIGRNGDGPQRSIDQLERRASPRFEAVASLRRLWQATDAAALLYDSRLQARNTGRPAYQTLLAMNDDAEKACSDCNEENED